MYLTVKCLHTDRHKNSAKTFNFLREFILNGEAFVEINFRNCCELSTHLEN